MFHRTFSLMLLQRNITAPCTVLDCPTRQEFVAELEAHAYDVVGLTGVGIEWISLGLESAGNQYQKLKGADTRSLVRELQSHGIRMHSSTIIGLEHHTPENIGSIAPSRVITR